MGTINVASEHNHPGWIFFADTRSLQRENGFDVILTDVLMFCFDGQKTNTTPPDHILRAEM